MTETTTAPAIQLTKAQDECMERMAMTHDEILTADREARANGKRVRRFAPRTIDTLAAHGLVKRTVRGVVVTEPGWKYLGRVSPLVVEARRDLDNWLQAPGNEGGRSVHAIREALAILARDGRRPELASAMLAELNERHPARYVTVEAGDLRWHLVKADGTPVEAGQYAAQWSGQPLFTIAERPEIQGWSANGTPLNVWVRWDDGTTRGHCAPGDLVAAWRWQPERI